MNVTVFGAGGFVGSHITERLLRDGHVVTGVDTTTEKLVSLGHPNLTFHCTDVRTSDSLLDEAIFSADTVVDLVAHANPSIYVESPLEVFDVNFRANLDIVERCVRHERRLIQFSSAEVYGTFATDEPAVTEASTPLCYGPIDKHRWIYACAKQLLERVIHAYGLEGSLEFTIIRPFNFVGPRLDYLVEAGSVGGPRVVPHFISALLTGGPMHLVDSGEGHRTFLHVDDATDAFMAVLEQPAAAYNRIFNVGAPGNDISIRDLAYLLRALYEELTGREPPCEVVTISGEDFYGPGYDDAHRLPPDISAIRALGWEPRHDLRSALTGTLASYLGDER